MIWNDAVFVHGAHVRAVQQGRTKKVCVLVSVVLKHVLDQRVTRIEAMLTEVAVYVQPRLFCFNLLRWWWNHRAQWLFHRKCCVAWKDVRRRKDGLWRWTEWRLGEEAGWHVGQARKQAGGLMCHRQRPQRIHRTPVEEGKWLRRCWRTAK